VCLPLQATLTRCRFENNNATDYGGGIAMWKKTKASAVCDGQQNTTWHLAAAVDTPNQHVPPSISIGNHLHKLLTTADAPIAACR
jgi:predicted outer membrane repeat protein